MIIQWFPGHMLKTQRLIQEHRAQVDVFLEVVDARAPRATSNPLLDELIAGKPRVVLLNKVDLADPQVTSSWKTWYEALPDTKAVLISCKARRNLPAIARAMQDLCRDKKWFGLRKIRGMIVGVPNVGKSSLINALAGGKKASVAPKPGHTRGLQRIAVNDAFDLFDTPGILWHKFEDPGVGAPSGILGFGQGRDPLAVRPVRPAAARRYGAVSARFRGVGRGPPPTKARPTSVSAPGPSNAACCPRAASPIGTARFKLW